MVNSISCNLALASRGRMPFDQLKRRDFITLLGGAAVAWPLAAQAQQSGKTPRVGYIRAGTPNNDPFREEFVRGMRDLGYVEGRNIVYEFRHYGDDVESIPSLINHLLRAKVDIIVAGGTVAVRAAQTATQSIPIVIGAAADPLGVGLVAGLARPRGYATAIPPFVGPVSARNALPAGGECDVELDRCVVRGTVCRNGSILIKPTYARRRHPQPPSGPSRGRLRVTRVKDMLLSRSPPAGRRAQDC